MKKLCLCYLLLITAFQLSARQIITDSIKIRKIAVYDADKSFKLNKTIHKAFRHKQLYSTSDFFKPNLKTTPNPELLNDSDYVKVFRHTAFDDTIYQIKLNRTKIVIVGVVVAGVIAVSIIIVKLAEAFVSTLTDGITNSVK